MQQSQEQPYQPQYQQYQSQYQPQYQPKYQQYQAQGFSEPQVQPQPSQQQQQSQQRQKKPRFRPNEPSCSNCQSTVCGRPNFLCFTILWTLIIICGFILLVFDTSRYGCPDYCTDTTCIDAHNRYHDCTCTEGSGNYCEDRRREFSAIGTAGSVLLSMGFFVLFWILCFACCFFPPEPDVIVVEQPVLVQSIDGRTVMAPTEDDQLLYYDGYGPIYVHPQAYSSIPITAEAKDGKHTDKISSSTSEEPGAHAAGTTAGIHRSSEEPQSTHAPVN